MAETIVPAPQEIDAILDQFEGWNGFPAREGFAELKGLMVQRLRDPARYALAGPTYTEAGVVIRGDSEKTGDKRDDRAFVTLQLGRMILTPREDSWTDVTVSVDDGARIGKIGLHGRPNGSRRVDAGDLAQTPKLYERLHAWAESGRLTGHWQGARYLFERWRERSVRKQAARILGTCAVDAELTGHYLDPEIVRKRHYGLKPVAEPAIS